jgi:succinyl-diaminopimelate desuccinylase
MSFVLELTKSLIARASVTPDDQGCQAIIERRLEPLGFVAERHDRGTTSNLWLRRGTQRPLLVFAGHTDVVPPGPRERWASDPFVPMERNGRLFGRGSADMKSSIAAFVVAVEEFLRGRAAAGGSIALLLTSDEEGPATDGTVAVVEALSRRGEPVDYALVGEPTCVERLGDMVKNGRRGSLSGRLEVRGIQGHVAYPHLARNPLHEMAPALAELAATEWDRGDQDFPPTTFQVSSLHGGTGATNVIPGSCELHFNLRFAASNTPERLQQRVEDILRRHRLDYSLAWTLGAEPFLTPRGSLVKAVEESIIEATGVRPQLSTTGGTSDGRFLARICPQVVEFGPPNGTIHQVDESILLSDLEPLKDIYRLTLERLFAAPPSTPAGTVGA